MKKILDLISEEMMQAFEQAGYDRALGRVTLSNRPDLCEYQCNGAMAGAKQYKKAPIMIANDVAAKLSDSEVFEKAEAVAPGFLNLVLTDTFVGDYIRGMRAEEKYGVEETTKPQEIVIDYGGPNIAKPLHVGHLRSAIIGESIKRIERYIGHHVTGDVHLGDWGQPMGLVMNELKVRSPQLVYFDESYTGEYPAEPPFTVAELEEIYPFASKRSKEDEQYKADAMACTYKLQSGVRGYRALWQHIIAVSVVDLRRIYDNMDVTFDLWNGESSVRDLIPGMVEEMKANGHAYISDGALVVDVKEETDTKEMPPCMLLKSDGASSYATTDLATIKMRMEQNKPDALIYLTDKRQELYFQQVFRCARKTGLIKPETKLVHIQFGTMNGKDGKPFKTREGGVMRLENLIQEIHDEMLCKIRESRETSDEEAAATAQVVGLAALKYGDLSNQASKDYIFDIERFTSSEGDTGPYILYTIVRIKSILAKYTENGGDIQSVFSDIKAPVNDSEKQLMMELAKYNASVEAACDEYAPHRICAYIYDLANAFNHFYHETKILAEEDASKKAGWIALLALTRDVFETAIDLLGFSAPERM
ncbi:MAG: arginine--tRNA ligase [Lachnospiraceae bacterium]|nr:arginine--tRNA ligase [Lachnospiraceae bacterium]MDE7184746.1 arginine--tRNA ligase [Lachnospiraceae bacterium]